jgi:hypothetical protein
MACPEPTIAERRQRVVEILADAIFALLTAEGDPARGPRADLPVAADRASMAPRSRRRPERIAR